MSVSGGAGNQLGDSVTVLSGAGSGSSVDAAFVFIRW
jgi:hypothetical protein